MTAHFKKFSGPRHDAEEWDQKTGAPGIGLFSTAVQVWAICQDRLDISVADAAKTFNVEPYLIIQAVEYHPWMFLTGPCDDYAKLLIEHEGE